MAETAYTPPRLRSIVLGILLFAILLMLVCGLSNLVKLAGAPFLWIPSAIGLVQPLHSEDIAVLDLGDSPNLVDISEPGLFSVYTDDYDLLMMSIQLEDSQAEPWLSVVRMEDGVPVELAYVERGLRPYDTPFAKGRPIFTFRLESPGRYALTHPVRPAAISMLPDYTTGKERTLAAAYLVQLLLLAAPVAVLFYRRYEPGWRARREERRRMRERVDAWWEKKAGRGNGP